MANVFVIGASRGIGLELARSHAARGDRVFAFVRNPDSAGELTEAAGESAGAISVHAMDIGDPASVAQAAANAGGETVDYLYTVAGVTGPTNNELESEIDWDAWDQAFAIMVKGPLAVFKAFLPAMHDGTKVINYSSQLAASTWPYGGMYAYGTMKNGLNRMMRSIAIDVKERGIIVITLHPGWVKTDMGGPDADITTEESVSGTIALADRLTIEDSGDFFNWNGERHAW
jgi:NAD(P)-dependent dehydrogenase (short-subunit alcohol dehydrogenase family)